MTKGDAQVQMQMQHEASLSVVKTYNAFREIMQGENPLTREEVERLVKKRPDRYAGLRVWLKSNP